MVRFPKPLVPGDVIAVTAPSSGVSAPTLARLDLVLTHLRAQGYRVIEGGVPPRSTQGRERAMRPTCA
jgi:muramoyltetrapeptide carboxypeptidase LdcA involved in peptidoglycan recycling